MRGWVAGGRGRWVEDHGQRGGEGVGVEHACVEA
jgi:hypothetical protein